MKLLRFVRVRDPEATAKWRLPTTGIVCRVIELDDRYHWQAWSEVDLDGAIVTGAATSQATAEREAQSAASKLLAESLSSSGGHADPDKVVPPSRRR